jgi:hypothetical protein
MHLPQDEHKKHAQDHRAKTPGLDAALTHEEVCENARHLNRILRFERTGHGGAKEVFMREQREARGSNFGEHDLKLLCTKLLMTKMFPGTDITHTFVKRFEKHRLAVTNQIRLMQDNGIVSVASAADFLLQTRDSDRIDTMQHKHLLLKEAEKLVLSLGFTGLRDFETAVPESNLTLPKVQQELHVLHLLSVTAAKIQPAGRRKSPKKQIKDKTKLSNVLRAAVGLTLQTKRASGFKRRKSHDAESGYTLAVAKPVQEIIDMPSELVVEHWYRRKYNQEPPHLDRLYTGNEPMTAELRATLEQRQDEEETRLQEQEDAELAAAMEPQPVTAPRLTLLNHIVSATGVTSTVVA